MLPQERSYLSMQRQRIGRKAPSATGAKTEKVSSGMGTTTKWASLHSISALPLRSEWGRRVWVMEEKTSNIPHGVKEVSLKWVEQSGSASLGFVATELKKASTVWFLSLDLKLCEYWKYKDIKKFERERWLTWSTDLMVSRGGVRVEVQNPQC